jgi:CHAT domain-containing protein
VRALARVGRRILRASELGSVSDLADEIEPLRFLADRARLLAPTGGPSLLHEGLTALAARLLSPLADAGPIDALRLVLDPEVPDLPWELLPLGGAPLAAAVPFLRVPSLALRRDATRRSAWETTFVALEEADLPGVSAEAARMGSRADVLRGRRATRAALSEALGRPGVVHVAGHGFTAPEAPPLGGIRVEDGWYGAADLPARVRSDVVVLAACRSGIEGGSPASAWGALPAALLSAGARRVLWTTEDVEDGLAAEISAEFHDGLRSRGAESSFGRVVKKGWRDARRLGGMLPFRLSGVLP